MLFFTRFKLPRSLFFFIGDQQTVILYGPHIPGDDVSFGFNNCLPIADVYISKMIRLKSKLGIGKVPTIILLIAVVISLITSTSNRLYVIYIITFKEIQIIEVLENKFEL